MTELKQMVGDREAAAAYLAEALSGRFAGEAKPSPFVGGRREGLRRLNVFNSATYSQKRNDVESSTGAARISPYIRHGCIGLTEAKRHAVGQIGAARAYKFIQELAWRQYWQTVWAALGDRIFADLETPKVPLGDSETIPDDIVTASTGLNCIDTSLRNLYEIGYVHNHARMWIASYIVHHRKIKWQAGATLFYRFLLDGDPASNSLSWQWVASTYSHKPYIFNRQNVEKYSRRFPTGDYIQSETYCTDCPAAKNDTCPFDKTYEQLGHDLFGENYDADNPSANQGKSPGDMAARRSSARR